MTNAQREDPNWSLVIGILLVIGAWSLVIHIARRNSQLGGEMWLTLSARMVDLRPICVKPHSPCLSWAWRQLRHERSTDDLCAGGKLVSQRHSRRRSAASQRCDRTGAAQHVPPSLG